MLVTDRYERIIRLVNEQGSIRVTELSRLCDVTEETIRRDLDRLEAAGLLRRFHGGAVSLKDSHALLAEIPYKEREVRQADEKRRIAEAAVKRISPHDRILLDASSTAWYMARSMPDIPMTVLTNSIRVATELAGKEKIEVISTGGLLARRSLSFVGPPAERSLEQYHVDQLFFSCKGVHLDYGISESNELQARIKQKMIGIADHVILLADASKFGVRSFTQVADLSMVEAVITDRSLPEEEVNSLQGRGIHLTLV